MPHLSKSNQYRVLCQMRINVFSYIYCVCVHVSIDLGCELHCNCQGYNSFEMK